MDTYFSTRFDHLVVCADELSSGVRWFKELSGVSIGEGGTHPLMATHNRLSALSEHSFLEIIATDPDAAPSQRVRWFELDSPGFLQHLRQSPALTTWVVATDDIQSALLAARAAGVDAGEPVELTRGDLRWQIALRADGTLACGGVFPILIQWPHGINPVSRMSDQGMRLDTLSVQHPESASLLKALKSIGADKLVDVREGPVKLQAHMSVSERSFELCS